MTPSGGGIYLTLYEQPRLDYNIFVSLGAWLAGRSLVVVNSAVKIVIRVLCLQYFGRSSYNFRKLETFLEF